MREKRKWIRAVCVTLSVALICGASAIAYAAGARSAAPATQSTPVQDEMCIRDSVYTVPVNIAGAPALSLPCGTDREGLPIGMQLIGKPFDETLLYRAGYAFEQSRKGGRSHA